MTLLQAERAKYDSAWSLAEYRRHSPGATVHEAFLTITGARARSTVVDLGCGEGRGGLALEAAGLRATYVDIVSDQLSELVNRDRFIQCPLWGNWARGGLWDYGYCVDVMEHVPPEFTMLVVDRILTHCRHAFFHIALTADRLGILVGEPLHLTVASFAWWRDRLREIGDVYDARDLMTNGLYLVRGYHAAETRDT